MSDSIFIPDYSKYSLAELEDIYSRMQKDKFIERVEAIEKEIQNKRQNILTGTTQEKEENITRVSKERFQVVLENIKNEKSGKTSSNLMILLVTIVLFLFSGMLNNPLLDIGLLIMVIFIHELGHLVTMLLLGYKDVRMFFIPFLGAAVTGKKENTTGLSGALIALSGPIPGIILSLIILSSGISDEIFLKYANISLFINALNLLPIVPLDGGKFFFYTLLCRNDTAEIIFTVLSSLLLLLLAVIFQSIFFGIFVIFNFISVFNIEKEWKVVKSFKEKVLENNFISILETPIEFQKNFIENISKSFPKINNNATLAKVVSNIWERIVFKVPNVFLSLGLIISYILLFVVIIKFISASYT